LPDKRFGGSGAWFNPDALEELSARLVFSHGMGLPKRKKADVVENPKVFDHVGLLANGPPGTAGVPFI
jgi:hypothetical protein